MQVATQEMKEYAKKTILHIMRSFGPPENLKKTDDDLLTSLKQYEPSQRPLNRKRKRQERF